MEKTSKIGESDIKCLANRRIARPVPRSVSSGCQLDEQRRLIGLTLNKEGNESDPDDQPNGNDTSLDPREDGSQIVTTRLSRKNVTVGVVSTNTKLTIECTKEDQSQHDDLNRQHDELTSATSKNVVWVDSRYC